MIKRTIVITQRAYVSQHNKQLLIKNDEKEHSVPIEDIGVVVLESHQCTITQSAISSLLTNNVVIISCDEHHHPDGIMLPISGNILHTAIFRKQLTASRPMRNALWKQTVQQKIRNQAALLKQLKKNDTPLLTMAKKVITGDKTNIEGRASVYYWQHIFDNPKFVRNPDGEPPNGLLNYGYSIVRAAVARALVASGLHPASGIFHKNQYNPFCLADDCMEPYRPYVDARVHSLWKNGISEVTTDTKKELLSLLVSDVIMDGERKPLELAIARTASSLAQCFCKERKKVLYPEF